MKNAVAQACRKSLARLMSPIHTFHILADYENRAPEALPYLAQLAKQYPDNPFFSARYAEMLLNAQRPASASLLIDNLLKNPQPVYRQVGLVLKARLRLSQGATLEADTLAQQLLQNPPKDEAWQAWAYTIRARVAVQTGQLKQARLHYKKVLDLAEYPILSQEAKHYLK